MAYGRRISKATVVALMLLARASSAAGPTPGFPEPVVQWGVQKDETCEDISRVLYGSPNHVDLINRYNRVNCQAGIPLPEGTTLILPERPGSVPDAKLRSMNPDVRARPPGGGWGTAAAGMPLYSNSSVNTLDKGRADIEFMDRTRVFLAPNTLVVIYGTANQTRVAKTPPVAVEVESGEIKAGLAALRGDAAREETVNVAVRGGGKVSAASRETIVEHKSNRTTVSVFDGKAGVTSGGKTVIVPQNFSTRFVGDKPPSPPRPLPSAPSWLSGGTEPITLALEGQGGLLSFAWTAVPQAVGYRLEVARDEGFNNLVIREEVPANIHSFRAERMPAGIYHMRVRSIDRDDYLGIASTDRVVRIIAFKPESGGGQLRTREIVANPYGVLRLIAKTPDLELGFDETGPFAPLPESIELQRRSPHLLRFRVRGESQVTRVKVGYFKIGARIGASSNRWEKKLSVLVQFDGLEGIDIEHRIAPEVRVHLPGKIRQIPLVPSKTGPKKGAPSFDADISLEGVPVAELETTRIDVIDAHGRVLGITTVDLHGWGPMNGKAPPAREAPAPRIGVLTPLWAISSVTDVLWSPPTAQSGAAFGAAMGRVGDRWVFQGQARASGNVGPLGVDAALRSDTTGQDPGYGAAWLGARVRLLRLGRAAFELAPALRVGLPLSASSAPANLEGSLALGGVTSLITWLANAGLRYRLLDDGGRSGAPPAQGFLLAGATLDAASWLRLYALFDAHLEKRESTGTNILGGFGAGLEAGRVIFGAASFRLSPFEARGESVFAAQLSLGIRPEAP